MGGLAGVVRTDCLAAHNVFSDIWRGFQITAAVQHPNTLTTRGWFLATFLIGLMLLVTSHLDDYQAWAVRHRLNHSRWWCLICLSANPTDYVPECEHGHGATAIVKIAQPNWSWPPLVHAASNTDQLRAGSQEY